MTEHHLLHRFLPPYPLRSQLHVLKAQGRYRQARRKPEHLFSLFDRYRCLFVHIPKAGGVSVYNSLFAPASGQDYVKSVGHHSIRDYELIFGRKAVQTYFTFTVVRNPWARVLSAYQFLRRGGFHQQDAAWAERHLSQFSSFDEFVAQWLTPPNIYRALHFVPQHEFLRSRSGQLNLDFVGRLETIQADFDSIKEKIGIDCDIRHLNKSKSKPHHYRQSYTARSRHIVEQIYRTDIETFGYDF